MTPLSVMIENYRLFQEGTISSPDDIKRDATNLRYSRTGSWQLLDQLLDLAITYEEKCDTLDSGKTSFQKK